MKIDVHSLNIKLSTEFYQVLQNRQNMDDISSQGASGKLKHEPIRTDLRRNKHKDGQFYLSNFLVHLFSVTFGE